MPYLIRSAIVLCSLFLFVTFASDDADATTSAICDSTVVSVDGALGYRLRGSQDRNDLRCEGIYRAPTSGGLVLSSFVKLVPQDVTSASQIRLTVPNVIDAAGKTVSIRVRSIREKVYYRMDARSTPGSTFRWPPSDILDKIGLTQDDLGFVASFVSGTEEILIPLITFSTGNKSGLTETLLVMRSPLALETVQWRLYRESDRKLIVPWKKLASEDYSPGTPIEIYMADGLSGRLVIDVYAMPKDRDVPERFTKYLLF